MRTYAQTSKAAQETKTHKPAKHSRKLSRHDSDVPATLDLQQTLGNQVAQRILQAQTRDRTAPAASPASPERAYRLDEIPAPASELIAQVTGSSGQPLDRTTRGGMEARFGQDFGQVAIHNDDRAAEAARQIGARAFTIGNHIAFGEGEYRPGTEAGQRLLSHELTHTLEQRERPWVIQRQAVEPEKKPDPAVAAPDPELVLGQRLWRDFPAGVHVVFYDDGDAELTRQAKAIAKRENAIAANKKSFSAADLTFGQAFPDSTFEIGSTIPKLSATLKKAADKAGKPAGVKPLKDTGPSQIRQLTVVAHGTATWCGISNNLATGKAPALIKKIASSLTMDVDIVLYACSVARGASEKENWRKGTMEGGGAGSLGSAVRDALVDAKKTQASVWGHTTVGHTTRNWALRVFHASSGKASAGRSYAGDYVFSTINEIIAQMQIEHAIKKAGHSIPDSKRKKVEAKMSSKIQKAFYDCYREANKKETYKGVNLATQAPFYPLQVAQVIHAYWKKTFWPTHKAAIVRSLIKDFSLPKLPAPKVPQKQP